MKTRIVVIVILLLVLTVLLTRNDERVTDALLSVINPIKQNYTDFTQELEDKRQSIIFQKESIEKLSKENLVLRKRLLEQTHYIKQVKDIYEILPELSRHPVHNISITQTISYVKLNSFSQIILTKPEGLQENKLYGLIQGSVVGGIGKISNNQLYGYLTSDSKCRFAVYIGQNHAPGIAIGDGTNKMTVKFIPKWHEVKKGDRVVTSGLDNIFFASIPVGEVMDLELHSSYKIAHIQTYSDILNPKAFFLVNNAKATLAQGFNSTNIHIPVPAGRRAASLENNETNATNTEIVEQNHTRSDSTIETNQTSPVISSVPNRIDQTQEDNIQPETPAEKEIPTEKRTSKKVQKKKNADVNTLDLF